MTSRVARLVGDGYDRIADRFATWQEQIVGSARDAVAEQLATQLPPEAHVLELGIGAGVRSSQLIAERAALTGVDASREQLRRAAERIPAATLIHGDFTEVAFAPESFDAVVAFYVLNHVPQERLGPLLVDVGRWLRPGGLFVATFATRDNPGWEGDFLGAHMFFAGFAPERNREFVERGGLVVERDELEATVEPEYGDGVWQWIVARKRA